MCRFGAFLPETLPPAPVVSRVPLAEALSAAVGRALATARPPVAVALSGGLDSTLVAAAARRLWGPSLQAFVLAAGSAPRQAHFVAARLGLTLCSVPAVAPGGVSPNEVARALGEPTHSAAPFVFLPFWRALAAAGVGTVLTGDGADELFAGHAYHRAPEAALGSGWGSEDRPAMPASSETPGRNASLWAGWASARGLGIDTSALLRTRWPDWTESAAAEQVAAELSVCRGPADQLRWLDVRLRMRAQCVDLQTRLTAAAGLGYGAPFADPQVVGAALAYPLDPSRPKAPLAALASEWLRVPWAPAKEPVRAFTGGALSPEMARWTRDALVVESGLFRPEAVSALRRIEPNAPYLPRGLLVVATAHAAWASRRRPCTVNP